MKEEDFKTIILKKCNKTVKMREPLTRDARAISKYINTPLDYDFHMISNLTGLSADELDSLHLADFQQLQIELQSFLQ